MSGLDRESWIGAEVSSHFGSHRSETGCGQTLPINDKILELATSLADSDDSELHVVYVWPSWTEWTVPHSGEAELREYEKVKREIDGLQKRMISSVISKFQQQEQIDQVHLLKGHPADSIGRLAEDLKIELLVMGTVCRTGVAGFIMGNTAERVLDQVNCSVLTIKPEGFQVSVPSGRPVSQMQR